MARTTSRSERVGAGGSGARRGAPRASVLAPAALALSALLSTGATRAATIERVFPLEPDSGASVGPAPLFELGYESLAGDDSAARDARFRITLRSRGSSGPSYEFDQRTEASGWIPGEEHRVLYRPRAPLADGVYRWAASFWNGTSWVPGADEFDLRIDSVPPAEILRLRLGLSPDGVVLDWDPVTLDRDGRPEFVARYHVYRCERAQDARSVRTRRIAEVGQPPVVDAIAAAPGVDILFYRVAAEDEAGNEPGRRD